MPNQPELDRDALQHLANLARLHLPSDRLPVLRARLQRLVEAFQALPEPAAVGAGSEMPVEMPVEMPLEMPVEMPPGEGLRLRADEAGEPLPPATVLANAPQQAAGSFLVPRVVDA
jgi:Asp-tRNA(Asn)/Glu-tRNA(Gln) amidotransferase C subunit